MERSTIEKGSGCTLDKLEGMLKADNDGQDIGFILITVIPKVDDVEGEGSNLTTVSNMDASSIPRLLNTVSQDLVRPALEAFEKTCELVEMLEDSLSSKAEATDA